MNLNATLVATLQAQMDKRPDACAQATALIWSIAFMMAPGLNAHQQLEDALMTLNTHLSTLLFGEH